MQDIMFPKEFILINKMKNSHNCKQNIATCSVQDPLQNKDDVMPETTPNFSFPPHLMSVILNTSISPYILTLLSPIFSYIPTCQYVFCNLPSNWSRRSEDARRAASPTRVNTPHQPRMPKRLTALYSLTQEDRDTLKSATSKLSNYTTIGSLLGLGLTTALAFRVRQNRVKMFEAFKTSKKPTHVKFADGREGLFPLQSPSLIIHQILNSLIEAIPDITPLLQPTKTGDVATYGFFGIAGLFLGGDLGLLIGQSSARSTIKAKPETKDRIEKAYRGFRADILRKELQMLESGSRAELNF
jgi:hypothetical protein